MKMHVCKKCNTPIHLHFIMGNTHITCPQCGQKYQFDQPSIKRYMLIPVLCVGFAVSTSLLFLKERTIDIKFIYILGVAFISAAFLEFLCVKAGILKYEEKGKTGDEDGK